ncbi:TVP38/TMEM64 family membrane protein [Porphyridium purpureum]|uniref:TVP38/TMEM64 family membrane protein n=1 Tax=Porphyridium purpureum TaxID=35688 RepID=A0A5J4YX28_PORPP|nr:TVP38/TMEM64 family membrane protein [Porphyridium purpureum]|eukprot:POR9554..scf209_3
MDMKWSKGQRIRAVVLGLVVVVVFGVTVYDVEQYVSIAMLKQKKELLQQFVEASPGEAALLFFLLYFAFTSLSIPGSLVLTLSGGALFGLVPGVVLVSFASTAGATVAFLMSRFLLRSFVMENFGDRIRVVMEGFESEGAFYLFSLRLIPIIPFSLLNLAMGVTKIKPVAFFFVSQLGMLPATIVFVDAGTKLAKINGPKDILSAQMMLSFVAIGVMPLVTKRAIHYMRQRKFHRKLDEET